MAAAAACPPSLPSTATAAPTAPSSKAALPTSTTMTCSSKSASSRTILPPKMTFIARCPASSAPSPPTASPPAAPPPSATSPSSSSPPKVASRPARTPTTSPTPSSRPSTWPTTLNTASSTPPSKKPPHVSPRTNPKPPLRSQAIEIRLRHSSVFRPPLTQRLCGESLFALFLSWLVTRHSSLATFSKFNYSRTYKTPGGGGIYRSSGQTTTARRPSPSVIPSGMADFFLRSRRANVGHGERDRGNQPRPAEIDLTRTTSRGESDNGRLPRLYPCQRHRRPLHRRHQFPRTPCAPAQSKAGRRLHQEIRRDAPGVLRAPRPAQVGDPPRKANQKLAPREKTHPDSLHEPEIPRSKRRLSALMLRQLFARIEMVVGSEVLPRSLDYAARHAQPRRARKNRAASLGMTDCGIGPRRGGATRSEFAFSVIPPALSEAEGSGMADFLSRSRLANVGHAERDRGKISTSTRV